MIQDKSVNQEQGFTMLEIVTVLVLLGVIASVAVPKYFDMQEQAEIKADKAALAEAQVRINTTFSKKMQQGWECDDAIGEVNQLKLIADSGKDFGSERYLFNHHLLSLLSGSEILPGGTAVTAVAVEGHYPYTTNLFVPYCSDKEETDGDDDSAVCKFTVFNNSYLCFDETSNCTYDGIEENAKWVTGSPIETKDGIYIIKRDWHCYSRADLIDNPTKPDYSWALIKWQEEGHQRKKSEWSCNGKDESACVDGNNGRWTVDVNYGDYYIDEETGVMFISTADRPRRDAVLPKPSVIPEGREKDGWVRIHDFSLTHK